MEEGLPQPQGFEILILCSGAGGKLLAWQTAISGRQTAVIEYRWIGGSCPNIGCLPRKNEIWSAKVIHRALNAEPFGTATGTIAIDMGKVRQRKREMSEKEIATHLQNCKLTGAELIVRAGCFVAPKTIEVRLNGGGTRLITGNHGLLNVGTQAVIPNISSLEAAARPPDSHGNAKSPLCAVPSDRAQRRLRRPRACSGLLPLRQRVTVIERGTRLMGGEDERVQTAMLADLPCLTLPDDILARQTMVNALGPLYATVPFRPEQSVVLKNMATSPDSDNEPLTQTYVAPLWEVRS